MSNQVKVFEYENRQRIRTAEIDGKIWFYAIDVANALELQNPSLAYARVDPDDLCTTEGVDIRGRKQQVRVVDEPGLYALIFESRKPAAKRFKRWVTHEVLPEIRETGSYRFRGGRLPVFVRRFNDNWDRIDRGHFSVISELFIRVYGRFEQVGYVMPDIGDTGREMRPDISVGKRFVPWLEKHHPHLADAWTEYMHLLPDGSERAARQYRLEVLAVFVEYVDDVWLVECAADYFRERDRKALDYLPLLLPKPKKDVG